MTIHWLRLAKRMRYAIVCIGILVLCVWLNTVDVQLLFVLGAHKNNMRFCSSCRVCHSHLIHICEHRKHTVYMATHNAKRTHKHTHTDTTFVHTSFFPQHFTHFEFHENHKLNYNRRAPNQVRLSLPLPLPRSVSVSAFFFSMLSKFFVCHLIANALIILWYFYAIAPFSLPCECVYECGLLVLRKQAR